MNRGRTFSSALIVAALSLAALPASAQERRDNGHERGGDRAAARPQGSRQDDGRRGAPQGRAVPRQNDRPTYRSDDGRASGAPAYRNDDRRGYSGPAYRNDDRRGYGGPVYRNDDRRGYGGPVYRNDNRRGYGPPTAVYRGYSARPYYLPRAYARPYNYVPYRPYYFSRPYYSFRPWLNIGFGIWLGDPVPYPYAYLGTYRPRVYGYYPNGNYSVSVYGGVSFDMQPSDADLFVDGQYVGPIGDFGPSSEPLTLTPGIHRIAVQRDGFRPMEWEVTIQPGQVIPYRGDMENW